MYGLHALFIIHNFLHRCVYEWKQLNVCNRGKSTWFFRLSGHIFLLTDFLCFCFMPPFLLLNLVLKCPLSIFTLRIFLRWKTICVADRNFENLSMKICQKCKSLIVVFHSFSWNSTFHMEASFLDHYGDNFQRKKSFIFCPLKE